MEQKDIADSSESSAKFSRYEASCARALRTFAEFRLLIHSWTKLDPVLMKEPNSDSRNKYKNQIQRKKNYTGFHFSFFVKPQTGVIFYILWFLIPRIYIVLKTYS